MSNIEAKVEALADRVEEVHKDVRRVLDHMEGPTGFHVRVDRLEQSSERARWGVRTAVASAFAAFAGMLARWVW